jgi:hypothetical protein
LKKFPKLDQKKLRKLADDIQSIFEETDLSKAQIEGKLKEHFDSSIKAVQEEQLERLATVEKVKKTRPVIVQEAYKKNPMNAFLSLLVDDPKRGAIGVGTVHGRRAALSNRAFSPIMHELDKHPGLAKRLKTDKQAELQLVRILNGESVDNPDPGISSLANKIRQVFDYFWKEKKRAGINVGYIENYLGRQTHNRKALKDIGYESWEPLAKKTFDFENMKLHTEDEIADFLERTYARRTSVTDGKKRGTSLTKSRRIKFKNAESFMLYKSTLEQEPKTYLETIMRQLEQESGEIAAAQIFGPRYNEGFNSLMFEAVRAAEEAGIPRSQIEEARNRLNWIFKQSSTDWYNHGSNLTAKIGNTLGQLTDLTLISNSLLSTIPDAAYAVSNLRNRSGKNLFGLLQQSFFRVGSEYREGASKLPLVGNFIKGSPEQIKFSERMFTFLSDVQTLSNGNRHGYTSGGGFGLINKGHKFLMKIGGLPFQAMATRTAAAKQYALSLGDFSKSKYDRLPFGVKNDFNRYGITEQDWNVMSNGVDEFTNGFGKKEMAITPEAVREIPNDTLKQLGIKKNFEDYKEDLSLKIQDLYNNFAERGSPTPNAKHRAMLGQMSDPNTVWGQLSRHIFKYKSFIVSAHDSFKSVTTSSPTNVDAVGRAAELVVMGTTLGYLSQAAHKLARGEDLPDPTDSKTAVDSFLRSGTGLVFADYLARDYSKSYNSLAGAIAGPTAGIAGNWLSVIYSIGQEDADRRPWDPSTADRLYRAIEYNTPSIPFTKGIINKKAAELTQHLIESDLFN